ncbi:unnamed protein product [Dibothriocephalus latus]|uniref:Uncharacterized protein n=1 Tax=Dibothriocephalus latus TaxID=60516 RepID=A0A3P7RLN6_DIBLA|nr:unnamed protein product [Dibothriocephalus latus]
MLDATGKQLQDLNGKLETVTKQLRAKQKKMIQQLHDKLDVERILVRMHKVIDTWDDLLTKFEAQLDTVATKVTGYVGEHSGLAKVALYLLCLPSLLALRCHLFSLTGEPASEDIF